MSNKIQITENQYAGLMDAIEYLGSVHVDEKRSYHIVEHSSEGKMDKIYNREQYLEFAVGVIYEQLECLFWDED